MGVSFIKKSNTKFENAHKDLSRITLREFSAEFTQAGASCQTF